MIGRQVRRYLAGAIAILSLWAALPALADQQPVSSAAGAILMEATTGKVLYAKNAHQQLPMASTTKIMTALLAIEHGDLDEMVTTDASAYGVEGSSMYLQLEETVSLQDQSDGLAYVLQAAESAAYNQTVNLSFKHQLAKVRVVLNGAGAEQVTNVEVYNYTQCTHNMGTVSADDGNKGWIKMAHLTYIDGTECWEANVVPGVGIDKNNFIRLSGLVVLIEDNLSGFTHTTLSAGEMYTINLTVDGTSL